MVAVAIAMEAMEAVVSEVSVAVVGSSCISSRVVSEVSVDEW